MTNLDQGGVPPPDPWPVPDDVPPRPRRRGPWVIAAVAVGVVGVAACCVGLLLRSQPGDHAPPTGKAVARPAAREGVGSPRLPVTVVYEVTSDGPADVGSVQYTDQDGDIITRGAVKLPWRLTFTVTGERRPLVVIAQRKKGATGPVSCSITYGEKVLTTATQTGRFASPQCAA